MKLLFATVALALGVGLSGAAHATNLVVNGDFNTDLAGWSSTDPVFIFESGSSVALGTLGTDGYLTQSVATTVGQQYDFSFDLRPVLNDPPYDFSGLVDPFGASPTVLFSVANSPIGAAHLSFLFTAVSPATVIGFAARNDDGYFFVDNVSVAAATTTPIPAALPLFASALGGLGFFGWRRKRASSAT